MEADTTSWKKVIFNSKNTNQETKNNVGTKDIEDESENGSVHKEVFQFSASSSEQGFVKEVEAYERGKFQNSFQYLCTCVSYAIGFSNIWRFPYLCYKNGGGAFLIPYIISLFIAGVPMMYMEMALGQFSSQGSFLGSGPKGDEVL